MTKFEMLLFVVAFPFAVLLGMWSGRIAQRRMWELHLPYEERLKNIRKKQ